MHHGSVFVTRKQQFQNSPSRRYRESRPRCEGLVTKISIYTLMQTPSSPHPFQAAQNQDHL